MKIVTIVGARPQFIKAATVSRVLRSTTDCQEILVHTGQHYDKHLSGIFFEQLGIRQPDYILNTGRESANHFEQLSYLTREIPKLFKEKQIHPDLIIFLGDSNFYAQFSRLCFYSGFF